MNSKQRRAIEHAARKLGFDISPAAQPPNTPTEPTPKRSVRSVLVRQSRKILRSAWAIITAIAVCASLLGFYVLRPKILIEPYASTDPSRPFAQQFFIQNDSIYPIRNVTPMCGFDQDSGIGIKGLSLQRASDIMKVLEPGAKTTLACEIGAGPIQGELNIVPWVKFTLPLGMQQCRRARFRGKAAAGGNYIWTYRGSQSCILN